MCSTRSRCSARCPSVTAGRESMVDLATYFAMARGTAEIAGDGNDQVVRHELPLHRARIRPGHAVPPGVDQGGGPIRRGDAALGMRTRPVLLGPISFLLLGKSKADRIKPLTLLNALSAGVRRECSASWPRRGPTGFRSTSRCWHSSCRGDRTALPVGLRAADRGRPRLRLCLTTYFGDLATTWTPRCRCPWPPCISTWSVRRAVALRTRCTARRPHVLAGLIDGRNIWRADLEQALALVEKAVAKLGGDRVLIGPSCSLLHTPIDLDNETKLDDELKGWMAFAKQKLAEIAAARPGRSTRPRRRGRRAGRQPRIGREPRQSPRIHNPAVPARLPSIETMLHRSRPFADRRKAQQEQLKLPPLPTTTIGSFPQTNEVRKARAAMKKEQWSVEQYERSAASRSPAPCGSRRNSTSTCWSTASASATTWSSTSASSSKGSPSRRTAGCRATARGASSRR